MFGQPGSNLSTLPKDPQMPSCELCELSRWLIRIRQFQALGDLACAVCVWATEKAQKALYVQSLFFLHIDPALLLLILQDQNLDWTASVAPKKRKPWTNMQNMYLPKKSQSNRFLTEIRPVHIIKVLKTEIYSSSSYYYYYYYYLLIVKKQMLQKLCYICYNINVTFQFEY